MTTLQPCPPSSIGTIAAKPAAVTPGMEASLSAMLFWARVTIRRSGTEVSGIATRRVCKLVASVNPGSTIRLLEGADHQHGADQKHKRHGDLSDNQNITGPVALAAPAYAACSAEIYMGLISGVLPGGNGAEEQPR